MYITYEKDLIFAFNSIFLIIGFLLLFYKIKYLNFVSFYITRMFLIISEIIPLTLIFLLIEIIFAYASMIFYEISNEEN